MNMSSKNILITMIIAVYQCVSADISAQCELVWNEALPKDVRQPLSGTILLSQAVVDGPVHLTGLISGFNTTDDHVSHGFHVHELGDVTDCDATGGHYNPDGVSHGGPGAQVRHVGDLGNIAEESDGSVNLDFQDDVIDFDGNNNILDRAIVIHAWEDDLGLTNHTDSPTTGNAGPRLACCRIVRQSSAAGSPSQPHPALLAGTIVMTALIRAHSH